MIFSNLVITSVDWYNFTKEDGQVYKYNKNDYFFNCTFKGDSFSILLVEIRDCIFEVDSVIFYHCELFRNKINARNCELRRCYLICNTINSKLFITQNSTLTNCVITSDSVDIYRNNCSDVKFYCTSANKLDFTETNLVNSKLNNNNLYYYHFNKIELYTDGIKLWAGCQTLNIKLVRKYINDEKKLKAFEDAIDTDHFHYYVLGVKHLLELLDLK